MPRELDLLVCIFVSSFGLKKNNIYYLLTYYLISENVKVLVAQSCLTLHYLIECNLPGLSIHGILQARILEWVAIPFSKESSWLRDQTQVFCIAGWFFPVWDTREAPFNQYIYYLIFCM